MIFILSDDHRYDFMGFMPGAPEWLETPSLDRMAAGGAHVRNAFVTTALCSPSRASILTGQYAHRRQHLADPERHEVLPAVPATGRLPHRLRRQVAHRRGRRRAATRLRSLGQLSRTGRLSRDPLLNVNGEAVQEKGYTTDLLTDHAMEWLEGQRAREDGRPFFLYLSHKAVHAEFDAAPRHRGRYAGKTLDESVGRVLDYLEASGLAESTLVIYIGDNGFLLGEHGLIDKRNAYEPAMRVPMLLYAPGLIAPGSMITPMVRGIDIAPTILELASATATIDMDGRSVLPLLRGEHVTLPLEMLYEYYWEHAFPHTPTVFALREQRYKYIYYHGVWDADELYDLGADPLERHNLIGDPAHRQRADALKGRLWDLLEQTGGMSIPLRRAGPWRADQRKPAK